jgi:CheY-like chemotaxis protein
MATILVAADSAADRHLIESLLREGPGWTAFHAAHGREALAAIGRQMPHRRQDHLRLLPGFL